ncbi:trehalose transport system permease protein SugB [Lentilactobacillus sunkii]|jgi:putative spermidine/putrescine transport system permease protein|uniref:Trehalose transport system permease protein SugB n=1 Tax=Lentilactobacillus sunkii TaxID=481719 RepID=A0A1E7XJ35_9LACO|nr:ABC transporter permease subunit [Lentilactobacillus sunkii]OFA13079.1 trehalose transport system permease protein SugB [Lentilactobacillus sunkii]
MKSTRLKIYLPFGLLVLLVLLLPLLVMVIASFQSLNGGFSFDNYHQIIVNSYYHRAIFNSLKISFVTSLASIMIAIAGAWALTKLRTKTKDMLISIFNMSSSFAGVPLAFSLIILFGNAGVWKAVTTAMHLHDQLNIYSVAGLTLSYTFFEIPLGIMFLFPVFDELSDDWREASLVLGGTQGFFLRKVILPIVFPNIIEVFILLFANAMGTYETAYALTGDNIVSIPILIGSLINGELTSNLPLACAFASLFAGIMTLMVMIGNRITRPKSEVKAK